MNPTNKSFEALRAENPFREDAIASIVAVDTVALQLRGLRKGASRGRLRTERAEFRRNRHLPRRIALATALAATLAIATIALMSSATNRYAEPAWAAVDVRFAKRTPLLLFDRWPVTRVDQYGPGFTSGELDFENKADKRGITLFWVPPVAQRSLIADRRGEGQIRIPGVTVTGARALAFYYFSQPYNGPAGSTYTAFWTYHGVGIRVETWLRGRPSAAQRARFRALLAHIKPVSSDQWLSAIPKSYLLPSELPTQSEKILADVPLPPGYDKTRIANSLTVSSKSMFQLNLLMDVECKWIDRWVAARRSGDQQTMDEVAGAVSEHRKWRYWRIHSRWNRAIPGGELLDALKHDGVWTYPLPNGRTLRYKVSQTYKAELGCQPVPR